MLKKNLFTILFASAFVISSCTNDWLNEPVPTSSVSDEVVFGSTEGAEAFLSGISRRSRAQFTNTHGGGIYSMYMARNVKGADIIQQQTWFLWDYENDYREPNYTRTVFSWEFPYFMINQLNTFINGVEASEAISEEDKLYLLGSGKALRGFYYFQLALEFNETYLNDTQAPAPPVYLETSLEGKPLAPLQELYDQIIADLEYAVENLTARRLGKSYVNQQVAAGMLTRVYQTTQNWAGVESNAVLAYGGNPSSVLFPEEYGNGFDKLTNNEWMWGFEQTADQSNYYYTNHVFFDHPDSPYGGAFFHDQFVDTFSDTDVRNTFFGGYYGGAPGAWFYYISLKYEFAFTSDQVLMRTAEMILADAEAKYHLGKVGEAHDLLFTLQSNRDPLAVKSSNTGQDLLDEILWERRKELYGEIGVEWFDAKRYGLGMPRSASHRLGPDTALQPNDNRFYLKIPQTEIDANEYIDDSVNDGR